MNKKLKPNKSSKWLVYKCHWMKIAKDYSRYMRCIKNVTFLIKKKYNLKLVSFTCWNYGSGHIEYKFFKFVVE